jgi:hypothetical protein
MDYIFPCDFVGKYHAPNAEELINNINQYTREYLDQFGTNEPYTHHPVLFNNPERLPLKWEDYFSLLQPSIALYAVDIGCSFEYTMHDPWINFYKDGHYQELHDHEGHDFSFVFFANNEENFANFYFYDRFSLRLTTKFKELVNYEDTYVVKGIEAGDIIFFPSRMQHAVSPQKSKITRKTLAGNFDIVATKRGESV